jgi:hypothetical protein
MRYIAAQPEALLVGFSSPPTEDGFAGVVERATARLDAIDGDDAAILAATRAALFDTLSAVEGEDPTPGITDNFGYNRGYMLQILEAPQRESKRRPSSRSTAAGCSTASTQRQSSRFSLSSWLPSGAEQ